MTYIADRIPHRRRSLSPIAALARLIEVSRQRRALRQLDDRALNDIGVTRAQADRESARVAWDAPEHWQR